MSNIAIHAQYESCLFSMPGEIRRLIYKYLIPPSIHIFLSPQGRLNASVCLEPEISASSVEDYCYDGYARDLHHRPRTGYDSTESRDRRVRSSWGAHWECKDVAYANEGYRIGNVLSVCKMMFFDLRDMVFEVAVINVTDLEALEVLTREPLDRSASPGDLWDWMAGDSIRRLHVSFRLPLPMYEALERAHNEGPLSITSQHMKRGRTDTACATWASVWPAVCWLPNLRNLHIWLELFEDSPWSVVRERQAVGDGIMAVLATNLQARARGGMPHMEVLFQLPRLHGARARPDTHFIAESLSSRYSVERRFRQRRFRLRFPIIKNLVQRKHGQDRYGDIIRQAKSTKEGPWKQGADINMYFLEVLPGSHGIIGSSS